jgi:hypothetical protein
MNSSLAIHNTVFSEAIAIQMSSGINSATDIIFGVQASHFLVRLNLAEP